LKNKKTKGKKEAPFLCTFGPSFSAKRKIKKKNFLIRFGLEINC